MTAGKEQRFRDRIASGYRIFRRRRLLEAWLLGLSWFLPLLAAGLGLGMLLRYRELGGWVGPILALAGLAAALWAAIRFGVRHHLSREEFLRYVERRLGLRENDLINAAEMEAAGERMEDALSRGLARLAVEAGMRSLAPISFAKLAPVLRLRPAGVRSGASGLLLALLFAVSPSAFVSSLSRLARPGAHDLPPSVVIRVEPGNVTVERGTSLPVRAELAAPTRALPELLHRSPGGIWKRIAMAPDSGASSAGDGGGAYRAALPAVLEAAEYFVTADRAQSETYRVRVIEPLRATGYRKRIEFPAYTGLAPVQDLGADGNLSALLGSRATLVVFPSRPGASGRLLVDGETPLPLESLGKDELAVTIPVRGSWRYRVELTSQETAGARWESDRYALEATSDRMPVIFQLAPERNIVMPSDMTVGLEVDCLDDFGLTRLDLVYRRNDEPTQRARLANWQGNREARVSWPWELGDLGLLPGDRIRYHLELTDNDAVTGPKTAIGPEGEIRLPSFDEMYTALDEDRGEQMVSAQEALERQKDVAQDLKRALQEMRQDKNFRWEDQERVKDLAERQEQVAQRVEQLSQAMERSLERMEQSSLFSPEVLEKVQQINELVREIQSPEFREQMRRLQEALSRLDRGEVQRAMQNLELTQEQLIRNLDRTLEMLQQLQREEKLDRLIEQAETLLQEQKRLNTELRGEPTDSTGAGEREPDEGSRPDGQRDEGRREDESPSDTSAVSPRLSAEQAEKLQQRQDALREELRKLQEEMRQLGADAEKNWEQLKKEMEDRQAQQQLSSASQKMQNASQSMEEKKRRSGLRFGREAAQKLEEFAQGMRQAQAAMSGAEQEEVARRLYALAGDLVRLSQEQEELLRTAPGRTTRELALEQQRLDEGARRTLDALFNLARESRFINMALARVMGEAVRSLESASRAWTEGRRAEGMTDGRSAGQALDGTVLALMNAGQSMCNSGQSGSCANPLARMRSLSGEQESLNQDTQQMMGQCSQGERLTPGGSAGDRLLQMAARQQMIRQGLSELQQSMQDQGGMLGRLGDIGKEMEEVVEEMRHRGVDERVLRRQERILSRLLTAQRSLRKEGQKEERVSRTGVNPEDRDSPAPFVPEATEAEALRRGILRGSQDPVPGDFRRLVEIYFRSLGSRP